MFADGIQVEQLFGHLINNALKFHNDRRPRVHIGAEQRASEWVFFVRDNGIGIDPELADRIFLVFQRLHGRGEYAGTGMGLAICQRIVERRGGRIWVESEPGKGSSFYFTMPQRAEARTVTPATQAEPLELLVLGGTRTASTSIDAPPAMAFRQRHYRFQPSERTHPASPAGTAAQPCGAQRSSCSTSTALTNRDGRCFATSKETLCSDGFQS